MFDQCIVLSTCKTYNELWLFDNNFIFFSFRAASPMGGPNGAASTENMNGDAKPTNSKVRKPHKCLT